MLDTNICIYLIKKQPVQVIEELRKHPIDDICLSSITVAELAYGVHKSAYPERNKLTLAEFLSPFDVLSFDDKAANRYGKIRATLEKNGLVICPQDMQIAAHALSQSLTLVTNNTKEFQRVSNLKLENWV